jgi:hypothetical protein
VWRAAGRVRSIDRGIGVADVEWQRVEYRPAGVVAGPRVRMTLTMPLGERVAVDVIDVPGAPCRMDGLIFEIGVSADHGRRLATSSEGRSQGGGGGGGGGVGRRLTPGEIEAQAARQRQGREAASAAGVVTRPMPPRQYLVDVWLVAGASGGASTPPAAPRVSQAVGGTGGRFDFPAITAETAAGTSAMVEISALVIPVDGDRLVVAITRHVSLNGASPVSAGWMKTVPLPKPDDVLSFEIPAAETSELAAAPQYRYEVRVRVERR